jgi:hypothetical protein
MQKVTDTTWDDSQPSAFIMLSQTSRYVVPAHHFASGQPSLSVFQPYGDSLVAAIKDDRLANDEAAGLVTLHAECVGKSSA